MSDESPGTGRRERRRQHHLARESGEGPGSLPESLRDIWVGARTEFDRQLLALSSAGIGLLVALAKNLSPMSTPLSMVFATSLVAFLACVLTMLWLLRANADFVEADASGASEERARLADKLARLDLAARILFGLGVFAATALGLLIAFEPEVP